MRVWGGQSDGDGGGGEERGSACEMGEGVWTRVGIHWCYRCQWWVSLAQCEPNKIG